MKRLSIATLLMLSFVSATFAQRPDPDYMDQVKRDARVNSHIEKVMNGKIVSHLHKGSSLALDGFIFRSDNGGHYHVSIVRGEGEKMMPFIPKDQRIELTVTGDAILLEKVIYPTRDIITIENKLGITIKGITHFKKVVGERGQYTKIKQLLMYSMPPKPEIFEEEVVIVRKKKVPGNRWAYILKNEDTILVNYQNDEEMKRRKKVSYYKSQAVFSKGNYFKSPNTYNMARLPFDGSVTEYSLSAYMAAKIAVVLDRGDFKVLGSHNDTRGLFAGLRVMMEDEEKLLLFHAKNGEKIKELIAEEESFEAFYKNLEDDSMVLHAIKTDQGTEFLDNRREFLGSNSIYHPEEVSFTGTVTSANFIDTPNVRLKHMILNDSIYVFVKEIVALNIKGLIKEGKEISITGNVRKEMDGEVNQKGYAIMAVNSFTIDRKTFKQQNQIKTSL